MLSQPSGFFEHETDEKSYKEGIAHAILASRPDLKTMVAQKAEKAGYANNFYYESGDYQSYIDFCSRNPARLFHYDCERVLKIMESDEMTDQCKNILLTTSVENKEHLLKTLCQYDHISYITSAKTPSLAFLSLIMADDDYLKVTDPENISLKVLAKAAKEYPQKAEEINQFIVDKFCKDTYSPLYYEDKRNGNNTIYLNDLVIISNALKETIKSGYTSQSDGTKYLDKIANIKYSNISAKMFLEDQWNPREDEIEQYEASVRIHAEYNGKNEKTLKATVKKVQTMLTEEKETDMSTKAASKIAALRGKIKEKASTPQTPAPKTTLKRNPKDNTKE